MQQNPVFQQTFLKQFTHRAATRPKKQHKIKKQEDGPNFECRLKKRKKTQPFQSTLNKKADFSWNMKLVEKAD